MREHVKFIIMNSGHDSSRDSRRVHASADMFYKSSVKRVRRVHWCRWAIPLVAIASAPQVLVRTTPGHKMLTPMPSGFTSMASPSEMPTTAYLAAG